MLNLTLAGLSADNRRLLLVSDSGKEFSLVIDSRLHAALRGEHARLGQLEIDMESTLRPRDIQARIRAGESTESVAQAASTTVDRILAFANPVLAERAHTAQRAQRSSVRRKAGDQGVRTLGEAVTAQLLPHNVQSDTVEWDSWRREDGRWTLTAQFVAGKRKGTAKFTFDLPGNYVTMENDDARWLVGEAVSAPASSATERDDLKQARQRRLTAVPEDELPLGDDAIHLANDQVEGDAETPEAPVDPDAATTDLTDAAEQVRESMAPEAEEDPALSPTPEPFLEEPAQPAPTGESEQSLEEPFHEEPAQDEPPARPKRPAKKKGRASVPSWDEIMFGGGKQD